jgi:hypothetical protein
LLLLLIVVCGAVGVVVGGGVVGVGGGGVVCGVGVCVNEYI